MKTNTFIVFQEYKTVCPLKQNLTSLIYVNCMCNLYTFHSSDTDVFRLSRLVYYQHYDLHLNGVWFESWPDDWRSWYSMVVLSIYRPILGQYLDRNTVEPLHFKSLYFTTQQSLASDTNTIQKLH
jgi:hypothetical protein